MAEITLKFDARNALTKKTLDFILSTGLFTKVSGIDLALEDVKKGRVTTYKDSKDMIKKVLG